MESNVKHEYNSVVTGKLQFLSNGNLFVHNNVINEEIPKEDLQEMADAYKGANRIHKPMALLFWQDCKNGLYNNWVN